MRGLLEQSGCEDQSTFAVQNITDKLGARDEQILGEKVGGFLRAVTPNDPRTYYLSCATRSAISDALKLVGFCPDATRAALGPPFFLCLSALPSLRLRQSLMWRHNLDEIRRLYG